MVRLLSTILLLSFICIANATEESTAEKKFPPYPDVWGYDLSDIPAIQNGTGWVDAYQMPDGDVWFIIDHSFEYDKPMQQPFCDKKNQKYVLLKFFTGEKTILDRKQKFEIREMSTQKRRMVYDPINFSDGSTLKHKSEYADYCNTPYFTHEYFIKTDNKGNTEKFTFLVATPQINVVESRACCNFKRSPYFYSKLKIMDTLIELGDDTFLLYNVNSNVIIRLDKNLNTKFAPVNPTVIHEKIASWNFFIIKYADIAAIEKMVIDENIPYYQVVHDRLLLSLKERR